MRLRRAGRREGDVWSACSELDSSPPDAAGRCGVELWAALERVQAITRLARESTPSMSKSRRSKGALCTVELIPS